MPKNLVGVFNSSSGGCVAECGVCGHVITDKTAAKVRAKVTKHYRKHPEIVVQFERYEQEW